MVKDDLYKAGIVMQSVVNISPSVDAFGYRIFFPEARAGDTDDQTGDAIRNIIVTSRSLNEIIAKVCKTGCVLIYRPRRRYLFIQHKKRVMSVKNGFYRATLTV